MNRNYFRVHAWLIYYHGRATKCENKDCSFENPKRYEWALRKGFGYEKKIDNFIQLCPSCHRTYDFKEETRKKISESKKGVPAKNKTAVILNDKIEYESITKASEETGCSITSINNNLKGRSKKTNVGVWTYKQMN